MDGLTGWLISAPVYWMFTKFLAINLPGAHQHRVALMDGHL
jgi:putative tricarboxylic transport membrane protein